MAILTITPANSGSTTTTNNHALGNSDAGNQLFMTTGSFPVANGLGAFGIIFTGTGLHTAENHGSVFSRLITGLSVSAGSLSAVVGLNGSISSQNSSALFVEGALTLHNAGLVSGAQGIRTDGDGNTIVNSGTILATSTNVNSIAIQFQGAPVVTALNTIVNSGTSARSAARRS